MKVFTILVVFMISAVCAYAKSPIPNVQCEGHWKSYDRNLSGNEMKIKVHEVNSQFILNLQSIDLISGEKYKDVFRDIESYELKDGKHQFCAIYSPFPMGCWTLRIDDLTKKGTLVVEGLSETLSDDLICTFLQ